MRDLRRAISNPVNAAGVVKELENILAVVPSADDDSDVPQSPARAAQPISRQGSSFDAARQSGLAGLAAGLGHMRDALGGLSAALPAGISRTGRMSDSAVEGSGTMPFAADAASTPASSGTVQEKTRL